MLPPRRVAGNGSQRVPSELARVTEQVRRMATPLRRQLGPQNDMHSVPRATRTQAFDVLECVMVSDGDGAKAARRQVREQLVRQPLPVAVDGVNLEVYWIIGAQRRIKHGGPHWNGSTAWVTPAPADRPLRSGRLASCG